MPRHCNYHNYNTRLCLNLRPFRPKRAFCEKCLRCDLPRIVNTTSYNTLNTIVTHSFDSFYRHIQLSLLEKYSDACTMDDCYACQRLAAQ